MRKMCRVKELECIAKAIEFQIAHYKNHLKAFEFVPNVWRILVKKYHLRKLRVAINTGNDAYHVPESKTLESLWVLYGLERSRFTSDQKLSLLQSWITILYGSDAANSLDVEARLNEINSGQSKANLPYYEGKENAMHIMFEPAINSLIKRLSLELPEYE